ncbi:MAG: tRNA pseudouridine(13) synthase TruD [Planctomycetes bacterium]|nr:tRNA pseudouridine(13) synthase TruD [Planctomycetota bacterium]MBT7129446.1 tRNA pseudouridine(13) synthase TruD [Planctomycetota bacterium]
MNQSETSESLSEVPEDDDLEILDVDPAEVLQCRKESGYQPPRMNQEIAVTGGVIRQRWEDFKVTEMPLYTPCGAGEHLYLTIEKSNRTTIQARDHIARTLGVKRELIGFAGFKDKRAITTQTFSVPILTDRDVVSIDAPWIRVLSVSRHKNKIRTGHLAGNQFEIRIREVDKGVLESARQRIEEISVGGLPNFYGPQRFGMHGDGARVGAALLRRQISEALELLLAPREGVEEDYRSAYEAGDIDAARRLLPPGRTTEAALLTSLKTHPGNLRAAARRIPHALRRMYYSAYQAELFNWVLMERLERSKDGYWLPWAGDICQWEGQRSRFHVSMEEAGWLEDQQRARDGEVSPTGPIFGKKMKLPEGEAGRIESAVLIAEGLRPGSWLSHVRGMKLDGTRRPLRIQVGEPQVAWEEEEQSLLVSFSLPAGAFATVFLEQLMGASNSTDASSTDVSSTDASSTDVSSTDASSTDVSSTDVSSTDASSTDASSTDASSTDASTAPAEPDLD